MFLISLSTGSIDPVPELRDHVEFVPKTGYVQAATREGRTDKLTPSEFRIMVKLRPSELLQTQCGQ